MKPKLASWLLVSGWALIMTIASSLTDTSLAIKLPAWLDWSVHNGMHVFEYAVLGWLVWQAVKISTNTHIPIAVFITLVIVVAFSLFDEWHQSFVPGRDPSLLDNGFDLVGGIIGMVFGKNW